MLSADLIGADVMHAELWRDRDAGQAFCLISDEPKDRWRRGRCGRIFLGFRKKHVALSWDQFEVAVPTVTRLSTLI